mgnify:CR=1 FL=1
MVVYLVQVTSVAQIVETIKKAKYRAKEDVIQSSEFGRRVWCEGEVLTMNAVVTLNSDPDVVATSYGLSLKDPVSGFCAASRDGSLTADGTAHDGEDQDAHSLDPLQPHRLL